MAESKKQQLLIKLDELQLIVEIPNLYLANYFQELRNKVDIEMLSKQILHNNDNEDIKNEVNQNWKEMISKIYSFEKECKNKDKLQSNLKRIDQIRLMLDQNEETYLDIIEDKIKEEEFEINKKIFQNKTIIFDKFFEDDNQKRLLIVKDENFIWIPIDNR